MSVADTKFSIYMDFENVFCNTDAFVFLQIKELLRTSDNEEVIKTFGDLNEIISQLSDTAIKYISNTRNHPCILTDFLDESCCQEYLDYEYYDAFLYKEHRRNILKDIKITSLGSYVRCLLSDDNVDKLYIYCKQVTDSIHTLVYNQFDTCDQKVILLDGDRSSFLQEVDINVYFIENASELYAICNPKFKRSRRAEVFLPKFKFNLNEDGTVKCYDDINVVCDNGNINVILIDLPII